MDFKILCLCVFVAAIAAVSANDKNGGAESDVGTAIKHLFHEKIEKKMREAASEVEGILQDNLVKHVKNAAKSLMTKSHKKKKVVHKPKKVQHEEKKAEKEDDMEEPPIEGDEAMKDIKPVKEILRDVNGDAPPPLNPVEPVELLERTCMQPDCPVTCAPACYDECCQNLPPPPMPAPPPAPAMDPMAMGGYPSQCPMSCMDQCMPSCPTGCCGWDKKHKIHHPKKHHKNHLKKHLKKFSH